MKKKTVIIVLLIVIVFAVPFIINVLFKYDFGIELFRSEWNAGNALGYYGSIICGALTLIGVYITIKNDRERKIQDDAIRYKPIIGFAGINLPNIVCGYREIGIGYCVNGNAENQEIVQNYLDRQFRDSHHIFRIYLKNNGRGETSESFVIDTIIDNVSWPDCSNLHGNPCGKHFAGELTVDEYFYIRVKLPDYLILPLNQESDMSYSFTIKTGLEYSDLYRINTYQYSLYIRFSIKIIEFIEEKESPSLPRAGYKYAKVDYSVESVMPNLKTLSK